MGEDREMLVREEDSLMLELTAMLDTESSAYGLSHPEGGKSLPEPQDS